MKDRFRRFANATAAIVGSPAAFLFGCIVIALWAITGPIFRYSDTWLLAINTGTSVITFLMVFLIHATQARDTRAMQLKLDELLRAMTTARNGLVSLEDMPDHRLEQLKEQFAALSRHAGNAEPPGVIAIATK